jgi:hypothetical protein
MLARPETISFLRRHCGFDRVVHGLPHARAHRRVFEQVAMQLEVTFGVIAMN